MTVLYYMRDWSGRQAQSTTEHSFRTYIIDFQKHVHNTSVLSFVKSKSKV